MNDPLRIERNDRKQCSKRPVAPRAAISTRSGTEGDPRAFVRSGWLRPRAKWEEERKKSEAWPQQFRRSTTPVSSMSCAKSGARKRRLQQRGPAVLAVERGDLAVDPVPIDLAGQQNQLVLHVDDLVQPRPGQIRSNPSTCASSAASSPPMHHRIMVRRKRESTNEIAKFGGLKLQIPAISNAPASEKQTPAQSLTGLFTDDYRG